jgi:deoxyhypusine synthase
MKSWTKEELLSRTVDHVDITRFDARPIVEAYGKMAFQARNLARATEVYNRALADQDCAVILTLAGSLISAGLKKTFVTLLEHNMVDAIVTTGANIVDQDFFEGLGFHHYQAPGAPENPVVKDETLREMAIDRIYDTYIDEEQLRACDDTVKKVADELGPGAYSSRQFIDRMGAWLVKHGPQAESIVRTAHKLRVPIFAPAFSDCSAGFGLVMQQVQHPGEDEQIMIDSVRDFRELTALKVHCKETALLMMGGGVPKNFVQDTVVAAELLGKEAPMHKYAVQITVADVRDGALSSSTLREACSWGKVDTVFEQMVYGEVTAFLPILASAAYHGGAWKGRKARKLCDVLDAQARTGAGAAGAPARTLAAPR